MNINTAKLIYAFTEMKAKYAECGLNQVKIDYVGNNKYAVGFYFLCEQGEKSLVVELDFDLSVHERCGEILENLFVKVTNYAILCFRKKTMKEVVEILPLGGIGFTMENLKEADNQLNKEKNNADERNDND